jgi:hypothetical protein
MKIAGYCATAIFLISTGNAAIAASQEGSIPDVGLTRENVLSWLQAKGYDASIKRDPVNGDNYVSTSSQGANWGIYLYACDESNVRCKSLQYSVSWNGANLTVDQINTWNQTKRFMRAYTTSSGVAFGEYDLDIAPGGTWDQIGQSLSRWEQQMPNFKKYVLDIANEH